MKKNLFTIILLSVALVCSTSCNKEEGKNEEKKFGVPTPSENVDYQLRVYLTETQLHYLNCDITVNVPGKEEQTFDLKTTDCHMDIADPDIDENIIGLSGIVDPQPQIYVCTFDYNGLPAGEAKARVNFGRNTVECEDSTETVDIVLGALWRARAQGQSYRQMGSDNSVYGGVYVRNLEEFLQTVGSSFETTFSF